MKMGVWDLTLLTGSCVLLLAVNRNAKYMNNFLQQTLQAGEKIGLWFKYLQPTCS